MSNVFTSKEKLLWKALVSVAKSISEQINEGDIAIDTEEHGMGIRERRITAKTRIEEILKEINEEQNKESIP